MVRSTAAVLFVLSLTACEDATDSGPDGLASGSDFYDLVFEGYLTETPEILIMREDGSVERLFPTGTSVMNPQPSPDGTRVAFVVADYLDYIGDIYVANRDGAEITQITFAPELDDQPSWSPGGTHIAFRSYRTGRDGDIWVMEADGQNPVNLTPDPLPGVTDEAHPAWSPDGKRIAYASNASGRWDIWTMRVDGSDPVQVTNSPAFESEPAWSPDGESIVFRRNDGSDPNLYVVASTGGSAAPLALAGFQATPVWTPDGGRLVFVHRASLAERPDLYSALPDGGDLRPLVTDAVPGGCLNPGFLRRVGSAFSVPVGITAP